MDTHSIQKILVAVDFADEAEDILKIAGEMGNGLSAELHLVHVFQPDLDLTYDLMMYPVLIPGETLAEHEALLQAERTQLRGQADTLRQAGAKTFGYMKPIEKDIAGSIIDFAEEIQADMILMGTSHPGRVEEFFLGSVAKTVLKRSLIPVLIVPRSANGK